jgi:hypothetical protein
MTAAEKQLRREADAEERKRLALLQKHREEDRVLAMKSIAGRLERTRCKVPALGEPQLGAARPPGRQQRLPFGQNVKSLIFTSLALGARSEALIAPIPLRCANQANGFDLFLSSPHIYDVTPENSKPKPPPVENWEAGADDRDIDKYFAWEFYCEAEDRSLDRMHEAHIRDTAARRAVLNIKLKMLAAGIFVPPSSKEHFLMAADFRGWAKTETDPKKKAELISLGNLSEGLGRAAHGRELEAKTEATHT